MKYLAKFSLALALTFYLAMFVQRLADARPAKDQGPHGLGCGCALDIGQCP